MHFDPEDYKDKLPSKFIEWKFEEEEIPPNTVEKTFSFERAGGRQHKIEIKLKELKITRLVYIDVPDIGKTGQYAAALNVASSPGGVKKVALINQYREQASAWGATFQGAQADALRHAFGLALCASDWEVGASAALSIAKGHEVTSKGDAFQSSMDLYNNEVGAQTVHTRMTRVKTLQPFVQKIVGKPDVARIQQHLLQKYGDGQLWIWDNDAEHPDNSNGQIIRSDDSKIHQSSEQLE